MTATHLTGPQKAALGVMSDGEEHPTWKRSTGGAHRRVNHQAAASLAMMGLAGFRYSSLGTAYVQLTLRGVDRARQEFGADAVTA